MDKPLRLLLIAALALAASAARASSFASSAADAGSSASGSMSDSFKASSGSSTGGEKRAEGRYRVTEVARAPEAGKLRLTLARDGAAPVELTLPRAALAERQLAVGEEVQATPQPYGVAFAHADTGRAFYLVLEDAWAGELKARVVQP